MIGFLMLAGWHSTRWEVIAAGLLTNAYISLAYGALPALIVGEVDKSETGVATSLNGIFRKVGGAAAAALVAALLTPTGAGFPPEVGFTVVFVLGAATAAGSRPRADQRPTRRRGHRVMRAARRTSRRGRCARTQRG